MAGLGRRRLGRCRPGLAFKDQKKDYLSFFCSKYLVARITQTRNDVALLVQMAVDGRRPAAHIGMGFFQRGDALGRGDQHQGADVLGTAALEQIDGRVHRASEILAIAEYSGISVRDTIARLRDAGLASIPGGGAEILDDEVRHRIARLKCSTADWLLVHRTAHQLGMRTTATMMFGVGETFEHRVNHFEEVRRLQEETGGFTAFIPWSFQPTNTALGGHGWDEATSVEYLKVLAIARLYLDNVENVQSSWVTQGLKVLQMGLHFGGNDVGSVMLEENVVKAAGTANRTTEEELRRLIRDAGFKPVQRDTLYRTMFLN